MGVDIQIEVMKAADIMYRRGMSRDEQLEVTRILLGAGVEHCLQEQEKIRVEKEARIKFAQEHPIYRRTWIGGYGSERDGAVGRGDGMKYFLDTEFIEAGRRNPVTLISIGIVREDGLALYAISSEFNPDDANDWVKANVLAQLGDGPRQTIDSIAEAIKEFVSQDSSKPEFWGYYADYDWVVFCQMFGAMIYLPKGWPMYCRDIKQFCDSLGNPKLPPKDSTEHNALNDARWNKIAYDFLAQLAESVS